MITGQHRVSLRFPIRRPNALFVALENHLHAELVDNTEGAALDASRYICQRFSTYTDEEREAMLERTPADIREAYEAQPDSRLLDAAEIDLIDFLFNYKNNRVLALVGTVGIGKTTFIRHVLIGLRKHCSSLRRFFPVILNCLAIGDNNPTHADLLYEAIRATQKALHDVRDCDKVDSSAIEEHLKNFDFLQDSGAAYFQNGSIKISSSHFVDFFRRLKNCCNQNIEPLIVFDNVDQLSPEAVTRVCALARSVHLTTNLPVLTAIRPNTLLTQSEREYGAGAFYYFRIDIPATDLRAVIDVRIREAISNLSPTLFVDIPGGPRLEIVDIKASVRALTNQILSPISQKMLVQDLSNDNIRKALKYFEFFLRYRNLRLSLLYSNLEAENHRRIRRADASSFWRDHLLDGLMIGDYQYFIDKDAGSPITNIFFFEKDGLVDYLIMYRCLSLLDWAGRYVEVAHIIAWLSEFGYNREFAAAAVSKLLKRGLIFSPESDGKLRKARYIKLSAAGTHYVSSLVENPQYIINAVYDVPLPHSRWSEQHHRSFEVRLSSIEELIRAILQSETLQLEVMLTGQRVAEILGSLIHSGLLTRRVLKGAMRLVDDAYYARNENARSASEDFASRMKLIDQSIVDGEQFLQDQLIKKNLSSPSSLSQELSLNIGANGVLRVVMPNFLSPANKNEIKLHLNHPKITTPSELAVYWQSRDNSRMEELALIDKSFDDNTYSGSFVVTGVESVQAFPRSKLTIFSGANPVIVKNLYDAAENN